MCQATDTAGTCHGGIGWRSSDPHDSGSCGRPPLLPVSLDMSDIGPLSVQTTVVAASVDVPP